MNIKNRYVVLLLLFTLVIKAQPSVQKNQTNSSLAIIPQEEIFVHYSSPLLFSGEYFHYKVYNFNAATNKLSTLSKVAYVELIGFNNRVVFTQKVRLDNGLGKGDFFMPVDLTSGGYKLVAYTQWMKNGGPNYFFQADVTVINPYRNDQPIAQSSNVLLTAASLSFDSDSDQRLQSDKLVYDKRSQVNLKIHSNELASMNGNYSMSVRKVDFANSKANRPSSADRELLFRNKNKQVSDKEPKYLPELRGELIKGVVKSKLNNLSVKDIKVTMSIPGATPILKVVNSNTDGIFFFNIDEEYDATHASFQILDDQREAYYMELIAHESIDKTSLEFPEISITSDMKNEIVQRSIYNQIENGYFAVKPDTIKTAAPSIAFFGTTGTTYDLSDFSRFKTIKETFIEIIDDAWTRKEDGKTYFVVRPIEYAAVSYFQPLTIVDGLIIQDPDALLDFSAKKVKSITILRDKYYLGAKVYQGVIFVETLEGKFHEAVGDKAVQKLDLFTAQQDKIYFKQEYADKENFKRIPDFRNTLLWKPDIDVGSQDVFISFYTSDNTGNFEVLLEGYKEDGTAVSIKKYIKVE